MDYEFKHTDFRNRRDALEATRVKFTSYNIAHRRKVVDWIDLTSSSDSSPGTRGLWKTMLGSDFKINRVGLDNKPTNAFVDRLLSDGRVDLAEFFMKMLVGYNRTGWVLDKNLVLLRPFSSIFEGSEFDVISTFFFCKFDPYVEADPEDCVDLHAAYVHVRHPFYPVLMASFADMYKKRPNLESKFYTSRLLSRFLLHHNFKPYGHINFTTKALAIMPFYYFPELSAHPDSYGSKMGFYGFIPSPNFDATTVAKVVV